MSQIGFPIPRRPGRKVWLRRLITSLLLAALPLWGILSVLTQPVSAKSGNQPFAAIDTSTVTGTITPTETLKPTVTVSPTGTTTPTETEKPTVTITATATVTLTPAPSMKILINEVAWAGTKANTFGDYHEWIELYNPDLLNSVDITGWTLKSASGGIDITLTGIIPANGYFLLERNDFGLPLSQTIPGPYDQTYSGALRDNSTGGDSLFLRDGVVVIDTANGNGGSWPAGNATTKCTMERASVTLDTDSNWFTPPDNNTLQVGQDANGNWVCGTPKNRNWAYDVTATPSPTLTTTRTLTLTRTPTITRSPTPKKSSTPVKSATPKKSATPTPNRATPEPIILNEFLVLPHSDWNKDGKVDSGDGFIELKNLSSQSISISGYRLDDQEGGSVPYTIKDTTLQPGTRKAFFASETGILLSSGGDSVRLYKPSGSSLPSDAFTYTTVVETPDQSTCRLPDAPNLYFSLRWNSGCEPTPNEANKLAENVLVGNRVEAAMCLSKNLPFGVYLAECDPLGLEMWSQALWDALLPNFPLIIDIDKQEFILE